jgi:hypothetical protein
MGEKAENYAFPAYKWLGPSRKITNAHGWELTNFPGGIGFSVQSYSPDKRLIVVLNIEREDGVWEHYIMRAYFVEHWGGREKWQTHQLVLFPYESPHGQVNIITFSYIIHKDGRAHTSEYEYKFARREDFFREHLEYDDFQEHYFKRPNRFSLHDLPHHVLQQALWDSYSQPSNSILATFTRGDPQSCYHPSHEIHRALERAHEFRSWEPHRRHHVHLAIFNFESEHITNHLLELLSRGLDIECLGGWEQVSSADWSHEVARLRRGGVPIYGIVRNTPYDPHGGIATMHTKIIIVDGHIATSSSYNLDFHRWGRNWENGLFFFSPSVSLLYEHVYQAIKGGVFQCLQVNPDEKFNLYYSFGRYIDRHGTLFTAQEALIWEIYRARSSIFVTMFDLGEFHIKGPHTHGINILDALIEAHQRGVYVVILLNGFRAEQEDEPVSYDLSHSRPPRPAIAHLLKMGLEVLLLYYHDSPFSPLHHKFAVFDEETVVAESYNWYSASLYSDEVFSVIRNRSLAGEFINEMFLMIKQFRIRRGHEFYV